MLKALQVIVCLLVLDLSVDSQDKLSHDEFSARLEVQIQCVEGPKAGSLLSEFEEVGILSGALHVSDSVNYFSIRKSVRVWNFRPVAVFGWESGYPKLLTRGPGTLPPEEIGVVVLESTTKVKARLAKLGLENVQVRESQYDLKGNLNRSKTKYTEIYCQEKY